MMQAPAWLPFRLRNWIDQKRIERAVAGLAATRPLPAADPAEADVELHMLICRRDLRIAGLALKSLLRLETMRTAVTLTDDGSLNAADRDWVSGHVPNARWLAWPASELSLEAALKDRPQLKALYHSRYAPVCKLMHSLAAARCDKVIVQDPDTAFFASPKTLIDWARGDGSASWYLHDHQDEAAMVPPEVDAVFAQVQSHLLQPGETWKVQHRFFNSGLLVFSPRQLDLDVAERYLAWWRTLDEQHKQGKAAIWFGHWTPEQTCFHVLFARAQGEVHPLGDDYWLGGEPGHVFNHFLRHYLIRKTTHRMLRDLIRELPRT